MKQRVGGWAGRLGPALAVFGLAAVAAAQAAVTVTADFGRGADWPLVKSKFNLYNTAIPSTSDFERDSTPLYELNVESIRIEQMWGFGQSLSHTVGGTPDALTFDWTLPDHWQRMVNSTGMLFHWGYDYTPYPLGNATTPPPADKWTQVVGATTAHLKGLGLPVIYHEVWNEPDLTSVFFNGTSADYQAVYENAARAIRAADPDAKIGGPTVAGTGWYWSFTNFVNTKELPLDFFSFHHYGAPGTTELRQASSTVAGYPRFQTTELVMSEYNSYTRWLKYGPQDTYIGATAMLHDFMEFLKHPELTSINWAQYQDPCDCGWGGGTPDQYLGLLTLDGHRKATFNALQIYGRMPPDRKAVTIAGTGLEAMASSDSHRASLLMINPTTTAQDVTLSFQHAPFANGTVRVYPIDRFHNSYLDRANEMLTPSETFSNVAVASWQWTGAVPAATTLYIEAEDGTEATDAPPNLVGRVVRVNRYYPKRGTTSYSDFDQRTWVARQGMGDNQFADQEVGVTAEALPPVVRVQGLLDGTLAKNDANSLAAVRIDFVENGQHAKGVLFTGPFGDQPDLYDAGRYAPMPFGTKRAADRVVRVRDVSDFAVRLSDFAPKDWSGRATFTFILQNTGNNVRVRWQMTGEAPRLYAVDCGSGEGAAPFGNDGQFSGETSTTLAEAPVVTANVQDPAPMAAYRSARSASGEMTYTVPGMEAGQLVKVRLHFAENAFTDTRQRLFDLFVNDQQMLDRFDILAAAGGPNRAVIREFFVPADAAGTVRLRFRTAAGAAQVNAIEVLATASGGASAETLARRALRIASGLQEQTEADRTSLDLAGGASDGRVDVLDALTVARSGG